jgi:hypothetical protein
MMKKLATLLMLLLVSPAFAATGFLKGEQTSGLGKVCYYDVLGSPYTINVKSYELCPLTINVDNPAPSANDTYERRGGQTGFLRSERTSGMNKICYYDVLGSTRALTISAVSLCPLNHKF